MRPLVVQEGEHVLFGGHQKVNDEEAGRVDHRPFGGRQVELWLLAQEIVEAAVFRQSQVVKGTRVVRVTGSHQPATLLGTGEGTPHSPLIFVQNAIFFLDDDDDDESDDEGQAEDEE